MFCGRIDMVHWEIAGRKGFSPAFVMSYGVGGLAAFVVARAWAESGGQFPFHADVAAAVGESLCVIAYLLGWISCRRAAALYPEGSPLRVGWLALSGNCLLSVVRHLDLNPLFLPLAGSKGRVYLVSQAVQAPALACVLFGILAIWWGVYRLGLGFRVRWFDCAGVVAAAALVAWAFRNHLSHAQESHTAVAILQLVSLGLLLSIGGVGLLLHGLAMQMGGGRLAVVMRCIAAYALMRFLLTLLQGDRDKYSFIWWFAYFAARWVFVFGAAYFCWLAETVKRSIRRQPYSDWNVSDWAQ
jgi:hypothetical protein